jgi:hypothetical protein
MVEGKDFCARFSSAQKKRLSNFVGKAFVPAPRIEPYELSLHNDLKIWQLKEQN